MARFPFFGFPYQYPYYNRYYNNYKYCNSNINKTNDKNSDTDKELEESSVQARDNNNCDKPILNFMGIKLFLDDIIILGILFLLYKEEVKDEMLFIALILLLLS